MKKHISMLVALCLLISTIPFCASATETTSNVEENVYAVIKDQNGNIVEYLNVEANVSQNTSSARSSSTTRTITYTARASTTTSDSSNPVDGVTAVLTISWNDFLGTENQVNSVSGHWIVGDETISERKVYYSAVDVWGNTLQSLEKEPSENVFEYEPANFTGYRFYLRSYATIDSSKYRLEFGIST